MIWIKKAVILNFLLISSIGLMAQDGMAKIDWIDFETAQERNKENPKKFIVDVYTNWCGWCKKMDATAFSDPVIVDYINKNYHAVKFNAESKEDVVFNGHVFKNPNPDAKRATHELASIAANKEGRLSYPTIVYVDENLNLISQVPGYVDAKGIEPIVHFFAEEAYKSGSYQDFLSGFKSELD